MGSGDSDADDLNNLSILRDRSRDLYKNNAHGRGAIRTPSLSAIGIGLKPQSRIDRQFLNLDDEAADKWQHDAEREFKLWAESTDCDAARKVDFYGAVWARLYR